MLNHIIHSRYSTLFENGIEYELIVLGKVYETDRDLVKKSETKKRGTNYHMIILIVVETIFSVSRFQPATYLY